MRQDGETAFMQFRSIDATTIFSVSQTSGTITIGLNTDIIDVDENNNVIIKNSLRVDKTQSLIIGTGTQNAVLGFAATTGTDFSIRDTSNNQILSILENKEITDTSLGNTGQVLRVTANGTHLEFGQASTPLTID